MTEKLKKQYKQKKPEIEKRLKSFKKVWEKSDKRIFAELCFCICTPQSKAVFCDKAITELVNTGVLYSGGVSQIRSKLKAVRFPNNKARFIFESRQRFSENGKINIKKAINKNDINSTREWIVKNVKGVGFKEASHFLRNIGFGENLAILDVHILKNMMRFKVIESIPKTISRKTYYLLEEKIRCFSKKIKIPMDELDMLLWSRETGQIFK